MNEKVYRWLLLFYYIAYRYDQFKRTVNTAMFYFELYLFYFSLLSYHVKLTSSALKTIQETNL